jgi:hypothetical protein
MTLSEKGLGLLGIGSVLKNKFAIGESRIGLKKSAAKKNSNLRMIFTRLNQKKMSNFFG